MDELDKIIEDHLAEQEKYLQAKKILAKSFKPGDIVVDDKLYRPVAEVAAKTCPFCQCKRSKKTVEKDVRQCSQCKSYFGPGYKWQSPKWTGGSPFLRGIALLFGMGNHREARNATRTTNDARIRN